MKPYYSEAGIEIYHGDCREILPSTPACDVIITDPPYSARTHSKLWVANALQANGDKRTGSKFTELGFDPLTAELRDFVSEQFARLAARWVLAFCDLESISSWRDSMEAAGLEWVRACIWDKVDSAPQFTGDRPAAACEAIACAHRSGRKRWNGGGARGLFRHAVNGAEKGSKPHPSTKPYPLMRQLIGLFSEDDELILDAFMGSGSTLEAAKSMGRRAIGIEIEERYCEIAANRLRQSVMNFGACDAGK